MAKNDTLLLFMMGLFLLVIAIGIQHYSEPAPVRWEVVQPEREILVLKNTMPVVLHVTVTIYHPVRGQTDSTPDIVASGKKINIRRASDHRWIAVSRDLLERWGGPLRYGELVYIANAGELSGYYRVEDTMNKRYTKRVDILRTPGAPLAKYENAELHMDAY